MRISTGMIFESGLASIQNRTSSLLRVQQQLSTGRRILNPSDDPVAAARALEVTQSLAANKAQAETRNNVKSAIGIADAQLQSATDLLARVRELSVQAGNAALSAPDRRSIALELRQRFDELVAIANARDGIGNSLFGGFQVGNKPFAGSVENGVRYLGDEGVRMLQVSSARQMGISQSGNDIFMRIPSGNGVFATSTQNEKGVNSQGLTYEGFTGMPTSNAEVEVRFWVDPATGTSYYDIVDGNENSLLHAAPSVAGGAGNTYTQAYSSGAPIPLSNAGPVPPGVFDFGTSIAVSGTARTGDKFSVSLTTGDTPVVTAATTNSRMANATIDNGAVTDPVKWSQTANSGNLEVRFWVDVQGTIATAGQAVGSLSPTLPLVVTGGSADTFSINVDGAGARNIVLTPGSYATTEAIRSEVQARIDALAAPPVTATVNVDANGRLVVTSGSSGAGSSVALAEGNGALALVFGAPVATAGTAAAAGRTFYDLVDATTGKSLFTGTDSTTGGVGNTYTRPYVSGDDIAFYGAGGPGQLAFDFGAKVAVSGSPASGDTFTVKAGTDYTGNGYFVTAAKTATRYNTGSGIVGAGEVLDPAKWNHPANSRNLEVRFWKDPNDPKTTYYDLVDAETEKSLFTNGLSTAGGTGNTYTRTFRPGDTISFAGLNVPHGLATITDFGVSVTISGEPASGDAFKIRASESQSVFDTLAKTILLLESGKPIATMGNVQLQNELGSILTSLSRAEDGILAARAVFGSNLGEVDSLDSVGENLNIQYEETLSRLQDLDYAEAITKLQRQQMELQAAQQSFAQISRLTLFDYIR